MCAKIGALLGRFVLSERLSAIQIAGIALCVVGAALTTYFRGSTG
jgi:drug/metabolite transporter (DMT)-like permease